MNVLLSLGAATVLVALLAALLVWLHFRAARPVRTRVPYLGAWDEVAPSQTASPAKLKLAPSWPFVRALLIAVLMVLALTKLPPGWLARAPQPTLLVLDAGAHMRAFDETPSRFERARVLAEDAVESMSAGEALMIAQLDSRLTPLSSWSRGDDRGQLTAAIRAAQVSFEPTHFAALRDFVLAQVADKPHLRVLLVSDGAFELPAGDRAALARVGVPLTQLRVGKTELNLAIRSFAVRAYPWDAERCEVLIEVENADTKPHEAELTLFEDATPIDVRTLQLPAHARQTHVLALGATAAKLSARISLTGRASESARIDVLADTAGDAATTAFADAMPLDDRAYAVLAQPPRARVLVVTAGQRYLESALALNPRITVVTRRPAEYRDAVGFDAVIFDRYAPAAAPGVPALWLAPGDGAGAPYRVSGAIERPFFDEAATDDPILRSVALRDVNVARAQKVQLQPSDEVIARSKLGPLIVQGVRAGKPFIAFTFDPKESDLVLRTAWPILISQALQQLTASGAAALEMPRTLGPELQGITAPGFYERGAGLLAVNTDPNAFSNIAPKQHAPPPAAHRAAAAGWPMSELPRMLPLVAALLLLMLDARRQLAARGAKP